MPTIYQICFGQNGERVAASLDDAMLHIACSLAGSGEEWRHGVDAAEVAPDLAAAGYGGSMAHLVRRAAIEDGAEVTLIEHRLDAPPGHASAVASYSLDGFDPSYAVQAALYRAQDNEEPSLEVVARELSQEIRAGITNARLFGEDDAAMVARLRKWQERLGGIGVIPADGDPARILRELPELCAGKFTEAARAAFPEAEEPQPPRP